MTTPFGQFQPVESNPIQKYLGWAKKHQEVVFVAGVLAILIGVGVPYYLHNRAKADLEAQNVLGLGQYYQHSPVDPKNGPFRTEAEREQTTLQTFQRILNDYAGTPTAKIARFYVAKNQLAMRQFTQANSNFETASHELKDTPLEDEALFGRILAIEAQGQLLQAIALAEAFMKDHSTSFIAPEVGLTLADLYAKTQNAAKAKELLQSLAKAYADSNWGKTAEHRLAGLK